MSQAKNYLERHLVDGTCNQISDIKKYQGDTEADSNFADETLKNGNEVLLFKDGSILVRIDDEAFDYADIEDYR